MPTIWTPSTVQQWFAEHVRLHGTPYTLDYDQAQAVCDQHTNTLVVARAGSGKTRIIVAKAIFLVYVCNYTWKELLIFMFNRAAAAEVNQRLAEVSVDQRPIAKQPLQVASTFHKFALDVLKGSGRAPQIISSELQTDYLRQAFTKALGPKRLHPTARAEAFKLTQSFIARAGQSYPTHDDLPALKSALQQSLLTATPRASLLPKTRFRCLHLLSPAVPATPARLQSTPSRSRSGASDPSRRLHVRCHNHHNHLNHHNYFRRCNRFRRHNRHNRPNQPDRLSSPGTPPLPHD